MYVAGWLYALVSTKNLCGGTGKPFFNMKIKHVMFKTINKDVKLVSLKDALSDRDYQSVLRLVENGIFQCHECHKNAFLFAHTFARLGVDYCEGYLSNGMIPHAFNCINGQYVDVTTELVNNLLDSHETIYVKRVFSLKEIDKVFREHMNCFITFEGNYANGCSPFYYDNRGQKVFLNCNATINKYYSERGYVFNN